MSQARSRTLKTLRLAALAAIGATALAVTPVWADTVTWTYNITSSFDTSSTTFTNGPVSSGRCATTNHAKVLSWGCPATHKGQSSLTIDPSSKTGNTITTTIWDGTGTMPTSAIVDPGIILTHSNFVINGNSLKTAELDNTLTLTAPGGANPSTFDLNFGIMFDETTNDPGRHGSCPVGSPPCPDIFVFSKDALNQQFTYADQTYYLSLFPASAGGLNYLSEGACTAAGADPGCFGFVTKEGKTNDLHFGLAITTTPINPGGGGGDQPPSVPEPGALGMMGFGLLSIAGLLFLRRRRTAEDKVD